MRWRIGVLLLGLFLLSHSHAQIILTEIMFDPDTLEFHNEFVEVYNSGNQSVDLSGWQIGDSLELDALVETGEGMVLEPGQFAVILDASYFGNSTVYDALIPDSALVLTIDDGSFGNAGWSNVISEPVILVDAAGDTVQMYRYSVGNTPGYSDEKRLLIPDNSPQNWRDALRFRGTPGAPNSVSPLARDGAIDSLSFTPPFPEEGTPVQVRGVVANQGTEELHSFVLYLFRDDNVNGQCDAPEVLDSLLWSGTLFLDDTLMFQFTVNTLPAGEWSLGVWLDIPGDQNPENNLKLLSVLVEPAGDDLVINEILFRPRSGFHEWVEIYHRGDSPLSLEDFRFADARDTVLISNTDVVCEPGGYYLLAGDSAVLYEYEAESSNWIIIPGFPALNNDEDDLKLLTPSGRVMDRVHYFAEWMRRPAESGTSLERVRPDRDSQLADNWSACTDPTGSTPGKMNSVYISTPEIQQALQVSPNPFSPDGDGFEDMTLIQYQLPVTTGYLTLRIFDLRGRLVRELTRQMPAAHQGSVVWDGKDASGRVVPIGIYLLIARIFDSRQNFQDELRTTVVVAKK